LGFFDPVFAEHGLASFKDRFYRTPGLLLAHGDQFYGAWGAINGFGRRGDALRYVP
jgi:hypothetical protein